MAVWSKRTMWLDGIGENIDDNTKWPGNQTSRACCHVLIMAQQPISDALRIPFAW